MESPALSRRREAPRLISSWKKQFVIANRRKFWKQQCTNFKSDVLILNVQTWGDIGSVWPRHLRHRRPSLQEKSGCGTDEWQYQRRSKYLNIVGILVFTWLDVMLTFPPQRYLTCKVHSCQWTWLFRSYLMKYWFVRIIDVYRKLIMFSQIVRMLWYMYNVPSTAYLHNII